MSEGDVHLLRLMTWLSPSFPVGAFAYSHGVERAIHDGWIHDRPTLVGWLTDLVERGSAWNDAVLLAQAWRGASAGEDCQDVADLAEALAGSRERHMETVLQGEAFAQALDSWRGQGGRTVPVPYPVAVGMAAAAEAIPLRDTLVAYLHAFSSNLVQAAVRLVPIGQREGVAAVADLEPVVRETARRAAASALDDLGSCSFISEVTAMKHETQYSRVFRS